jgi:hypothetical protein
VVGGLQTGIICAVLICGVAGKYSGDIEDDRGLLEGEGILRRWFVGEGIVPIRSIAWLAELRSHDSQAQYQVKDILM